MKIILPVVVLVLSAVGFSPVSANVYPIHVDVTHGAVCQFLGSCLLDADRFRDPTGRWQVSVNTDGTLSTSDPYHLLFDSDAQSIQLAVGNPLHSGDFIAPVENISLGQVAVEAVPVPASVWLFGSTLGILGLMRRR